MLYKFLHVGIPVSFFRQDVDVVGERLLIVKVYHAQILRDAGGVQVVHDEGDALPGLGKLRQQVQPLAQEKLGLKAVFPALLQQKGSVEIALTRHSDEFTLQILHTDAPAPGKGMSFVYIEAPSVSEQDDVIKYRVVFGAAA